jgi:hypothetical protein
MIRTFLVAINFSDDIIDPVGEAGDIEDACLSAGLDVESVKMWTAPSLAAPPLAMQPLPQNPQQL